jgi:hypothetical protein
MRSVLVALLVIAFFVGSLATAVPQAYRGIRYGESARKVAFWPLWCLFAAILIAR